MYFHPDDLVKNPSRVFNSTPKLHEVVDNTLVEAAVVSPSKKGRVVLPPLKNHDQLVNKAVERKDLNPKKRVNKTMNNKMEEFNGGYAPVHKEDLNSE